MFESDRHGYDTRLSNHRYRLGTNEDFAVVCASLHEAGIRVVLMAYSTMSVKWGVLGRAEKRNSPAIKCVFINFDGNDAYNGQSVVRKFRKLNLRNP